MNTFQNFYKYILSSKFFNVVQMCLLMYPNTFSSFVKGSQKLINLSSVINVPLFYGIWKWFRYSMNIYHWIYLNISWSMQVTKKILETVFLSTHTIRNNYCWKIHLYTFILHLFIFLNNYIWASQLILW